MPLEEATYAETQEMATRANAFLSAIWKMYPGIQASAVVETIGMALRLIYQEAKPEFRREMLKYLAANLAEMREIDA